MQAYITLNVFYQFQWGKQILNSWKGKHHLLGTCLWRYPVLIYHIGRDKSGLVKSCHLSKDWKNCIPLPHYLRSKGTLTKKTEYNVAVEERVNINERYTVSDVKVKGQLISETSPPLYDGWMWHFECLTVHLERWEDEKGLIKIQANSLINQHHDICWIRKHVSANFSLLFH